MATSMAAFTASGQVVWHFESKRNSKISHKISTFDASHIRSVGRTVQLRSGPRRVQGLASPSPVGTTRGLRLKAMADDSSLEDAEDAVAEMAAQAGGAEKEAAQAGATAEAAGEASAAIARFQEQGGGKFFCAPLQIVSGAPAVMYFQRSYSQLNASNRRETNMIGAWNDWQMGEFRSQMSPVDGVPGDWWRLEFQVPENAYNMRFVFSDGGQSFDKQEDGEDYTLEPAFAPSREELVELMQREKHLEELRLQAEADMNAAWGDVNHQREGMQGRMEAAYTAWDREDGARVVRTLEPLVPGKRGVLLYNAEASSLNNQQELVMHQAFNGWAGETQKRAMRRSAREGFQGQWFEVEVDVPKLGYVLDFVMSNKEESMWDNNARRDYHIVIGNDQPITEVQWEEAAMARFKEIRANRLESQLAEEQRQEEKAKKRAAVREASLAVMRKKLMHVLYTEPAVPVAGQECTLFYNNKNTNLAWSGEVWMRAGFNRWEHPAPLPPIKMAPAATEDSHLAASFVVPADAHTVDVVFSSSGGEDAQYDNASGLDYHFATKGASTKPSPLHIMHVAVEMAPIAKVGGLGDVVTSLSRAVQELGHTVEVVLPKFAFLQHSPLLGNMQWETRFEWGGCEHNVFTQIVEDVRVFFIEPSNGMFNSSTVYQGNGDGPRFDFFCKAALEFMLQTQRQPDIIHAHDWSTALTTKFFWESYVHNGLWKPRCIFTIHNLEFGAAKIGEAMYASQMATTVSPSYAAEISGHGAVSGNLGKLHGVVNGIDTDIWDPETDAFLPKNFTYATCAEGKEACRRALRERLGLTGWEDRPVVGIVTRLTAQKGIHLIKHCAGHTKFRGAQFVLLGSAPDPKVQAEFNALASQTQDENAAFVYTYDEPLSHLIYAGCDFICVPSMFEPCGLTQLIAMRYGAIPIVRRTGGLADTVYDVDHDAERAAWEMFGSTNAEADGVDGRNGFSFEGTDSNALSYGLDRALDCFYGDREWFRGLQARTMQQDWSWNRPANMYLELYHQAKKA